MEIKIEHKTTVTLFERAFEMTPNEFKDFLKACRTMLEREGCITDEPMIKITKEGLETFKSGLSTEQGDILLQVSNCSKKEEFKALQPECREIAEFVVDPVEPEDRTEKISSWSGRYGEITTATDLPDEPEINSKQIEEAEMIKPMDINAQMDFVCREP